MARTKKSGFRRCPICGHHADRKDMRYTTDANGIRCRLEKQQATLEYVAAMADIDLPVEEATEGTDINDEEEA